MEVFNINGTEETLKVSLDNVKGELNFSGVSLPENVNDFFEPILDWIENYAVDPVEETQISFDLKYYNTASSKYFLDILERLALIQKQKKKVKVTWSYDADDEDIEESGYSLQELTKLPFTFNPY